MSQELIKEELWEERVNASSGSHFFINRLTKAVRYNPPDQFVPVVSKFHRVDIVGFIDVFKKQLVIIMSSASLDQDAKVKQCCHILADTWNLLCTEANREHAACPVFFIGTLLDVYDYMCVSASVMLGSDTCLAPCLSFLVKAKNGATLFLQTLVPLYLMLNKTCLFHLTIFLLQKL
jgi:hypothetical protein